MSLFDVFRPPPPPPPKPPPPPPKAPAPPPAKPPNPTVAGATIHPTSTFQPASPGASGWSQFNGAAAAAKPAGQTGILPPIDQSHLGMVDKMVVNTLGLGNVPPGSTTTVEVKANAQLAAVLGVDVGATVTVSASRDAENPNQFTFSFGGGGTAEVEGSPNSTGATAQSATGVDGSVSIEFKVDFSQPGEATQFAGFVGHMGLMAAVPAAADALGIIESIPGVNLPGEPVPFLQDHISAIEVSGNYHLSEEVGAVMGEGGSIASQQFLQGGGRIDFNPDGTLTLTGKVGAGYEWELSNGVGADNALEASGVVAAQNAEINFVSQTTVDPSVVPPTVLSQSGGVEIEIGGELLTGGVTAKVNIDLQEALAGAPPDVQARMREALRTGDVAEAGRIFTQEVLTSTSVSGSVEITGSSRVKGALEAGLEEMGAGAKGSIEGSVKEEITIYSGEVTIDANGVTADTGFLGHTEPQQMTWEELLQELQQGPG
ncbi:MAG TPA: hypothetical protein VFA20_29540 [Myxococcaceae bacterium]|nr:hypothetical protein [Myxococcaceae bacterium]